MRLTRLNTIPLGSGNVPIAEERNGSAVTATSDSDVRELLVKVLEQLELQTELLAQLK